MDALQIVDGPSRHGILRLLRDREPPAGEIADAAGAVSRHLRILREAGSIRIRRAAPERWYRADGDAHG